MMAKDYLDLPERIDNKIYIGIGLNTLQEEISKENSDFPFFKIGKKVMVDKNLFRQWLENISKTHQKLRR